MIYNYAHLSAMECKLKEDYTRLNDKIWISDNRTYANIHTSELHLLGCIIWDIFMYLSFSSSNWNKSICLYYLLKMAKDVFRTLKSQFSIDMELYNSGSGNRPSTPIQRLRRYLSINELPGYRSDEFGLKTSEITDSGHELGLGNPKIINAIFCHLSATELVSIRLVSLRWNHVACTYLRRRLSPCRIRPSKLKLFLKHMKRCFCNPFASYAIRIENLQNLHIRSFFRRFSLDIIRLRVKLASEELPNFCKLLHTLRNLEELELLRIPEGPLSRGSASEYINESAWKNGAFLFPSLKILSFDSDDPSTPFTKSYDNCLFDVINSSPNLVKISFKNWDSHLSRLFHRCGISNPKSFDGWHFPAVNNPTLRQDVEELFFIRRMKYKAIQFSLNNEGNEQQLSFQLANDLIFETHQHLYHLALMNPRSDEIFQVDIKMNLLLTLGLQSWTGPVNFELLSSNFPNLQTLKVVPCNFSLNEDDEFETAVYEHLFSLTVMPRDPREIQPVGFKLMKRIAQMFPSLKQLYLQLCENESMGVIYEQYGDTLEHLCIDLMDDVGDEAMTGLPEDQIVIKGNEDCGCTSIHIQDQLKLTAKGIGCMKGLKTLLLRSDPDYGAVTDISFTEGISKLKSLKTLWLLSPVGRTLVELGNEKFNPGSCSTPVLGTERGSSSRRPWCLKAIADALPNLKFLGTSNDVHYSDEEIEYLRQNIPHIDYETRD